MNALKSVARTQRVNKLYLMLYCRDLFYRYLKLTSSLSDGILDK